nr:TorF family putative porin [Sphingomonas laterariae]
MRKFVMGLSALALTVAAAPAFAADEAESTSDWALSGGVTAVSDYRFRGISLSDEDPAIQPTLTLSHSSGFYGGTWMSNLDDTDTYGEWEIDLYAGWTGEVASGTTVDAAVVYYYYPGGHGDSDYFEPYVSVAHTFGPVTAKGGVNWAPSSDATGNEDYVYLYGQLSAAIPNTPVTLTGRLGNQDLGPSSYTEWAIGASATFGAITAGIQYVDTDLGDLPNVDAGVVFSVGFAF